MVTSINGNNITWREHNTGELVIDPRHDLEIVNMAYNNRNYQIRQNLQCCDNWEHQMPNGQWMCGKTHGVCTNNSKTNRGRKYNPGGMLHGPTHEQGGIPALVGGNTAIELEGGEYIINKQTVNAVGEGFLNKLNSTGTTHHQGGFQQGQLPSPSMYANGGKVSNRRNKMARRRTFGGGNRSRRSAQSPIRNRSVTRGGSTRSRTYGTPSENRRSGRGMSNINTPKRFQNGGMAYGNGSRMATRTATTMTRRTTRSSGYNPCTNLGPERNGYNFHITTPPNADGNRYEMCCKTIQRDHQCVILDDSNKMKLADMTQANIPRHQKSLNRSGNARNRRR